MGFRYLQAQGLALDRDIGFLYIFVLFYLPSTFSCLAKEIVKIINCMNFCFQSVFRITAMYVFSR